MKSCSATTALLDLIPIFRETFVTLNSTNTFVSLGSAMQIGCTHKTNAVKLVSEL